MPAGDCEGKDVSGRVGGILGTEVSGVNAAAKDIVDALFLPLDSHLFQVSGRHWQLCCFGVNAPLPGPPSRLQGSWSF